jgi:UDP-N-acetylglucosamine--dolichyl-phosphate N-acetylglucosaminephosphotransferase
MLSLIISICAFRLTTKMIPIFMQINHSKKIFGVDINKVEDIKDLSDPNRKEVPEALGIVPATVFLIATILLKSVLPLDQKSKLEFTSCLFSICFMVFLGFTDDILDLRWRYKLVLPTIASFPLLLAYSGSTALIIPKFLQPFIGVSSFDIGFLFNIYMAMLAVFCTNSINIYAGINGLEVGQSIIIGLSIIFFNLIEFLNGNVEKSLFSMAVMLPFIFTSLALFTFNSFPAQCFIGDTYCYFAGMTFACVGIIGNFPVTLLLFFIPQILNFIISLPQVHLNLINN